MHMTKIERIRGELVRLCASRRTRRTEFTRERPTNWRPQQVVDPETEQPFTDEGAWAYIAAILEQGHEIEQIFLKKPLGKSGYVLKIMDKKSGKTIYVKLQIGSGFVYGRSFHYSDY